MSSMPQLLVVEDQTLLRLELEDILKDAGFQTTMVADARSALIEIEADISKYGALVTDINLGNGPNGWDIARKARQLYPALPIVYMSGASQGEWTAQGVPKSIMISEPFAPAQLVTAVATLMNDSVGVSDAN